MTGPSPHHPGKNLKAFMAARNWSAAWVARRIGSTPQSIAAIVREDRRVSPEMALRLGRILVDAMWWAKQQARYDLEAARKLIQDELDAIVPIGDDS